MTVIALGARSAHDTATTTRRAPLCHDPLCPSCGHAGHRYLPCSDTCACQPPPVPGAPAAVPHPRAS